MDFFGLNINIYGLMYALSFILGFIILKKRKFFTETQLDDFFLYIFLGVVFGGRFGYIVFYNLEYYITNIHKIFFVWEGGMSFHGGVVGVIIAMLLFSRKNNLNFLKVSDELTSVLPIGLFLGRIGNYFNKELLGYSGYTGWFGVEKNGTTYFPSPLLEAVLEGFVLFFILMYFYKNKKFDGQIATLFLIGYGVFRLFVELNFRQPDDHIGYIIGNLSLGSLLTLPMIILGIGLYIYFSRKNYVK